MKKTVFITGGARSGKSSFAMAEASKIPGKKAYVATAQALDEEMRQRIEHHQKQRDSEWTTHEEPLKIATLIEAIRDDYSVVLIDCLTLWLSNLMQGDIDAEAEVKKLVSMLGQPHPPIYLVSNEVGMGIVPDNRLARSFRDMAGFLNQKMAAAADEVYVTVAGIPVQIKGG